MVNVIGVRFRDDGKLYFFDPGTLWPTPGDYVIVETSRGLEFAETVTTLKEIDESGLDTPLRPVVRIATAEDVRHNEENHAGEREAHAICQKKIAEHKLDMKLVSVEYTFDNSKILFYFTANGRVDFRSLVKDLASIFHTRIELRQIGVRDKAKMVGGLGICGRPFCCSQFLDDFQPVSIKMAKTQNLSLNPTKISGTCGRLMCCLKYEQEAYEDLIRTSPKMDSFVDTPEGRGTIVDVNLLRQNVKVRMEDSPETISCFHNCDVCVLRSGKAKKNDPPIPADLAPISGQGKRPVKREEKEEPRLLEPVRFRYRDENVVEEKPQVQQDEPAVNEEAGESRSRRRRRQKSGREDRPAEQKQERPEKPEKPAKAEKPERQDKQEKQENKPRPPKKPRPERKPEGEKQAPAEAENQKPAAEAGEGAEGEHKSRRRRPNYRRRKPRNPGEGGGNAEG